MDFCFFFWDTCILFNNILTCLKELVIGYNRPCMPLFILAQFQYAHILKIFCRNFFT
jgi:hypothetical protein